MPRPPRSVRDNKAAGGVLYRVPPKTMSVDLSEILVFTRVVQGGSFTAASSSLGMPKSTVSRKLSELEERIGARLLQRTTRRLSLTDVGRTYYEHCVRIVAELEEAQLAVTQLQSTPKGLLRLTAPATFSPLGPILAEYLRLYPDVHVEVVCTDRNVDLVEERFDLALRFGYTPDSTMISRKLGVVRRFLFAAPAFIDRLGAPKEPADLERLPCLVFAPVGGTWALASASKELEVTVSPRLAINDYDLLRSLAREGIGIALLPEYQCLEDVTSARLRRVLDAWAAPGIPIFALYPSTRHLSPKVVSLLELLRSRLAMSISASGGSAIS
jgi:DNA-binding transcriptional LysR family regulator